ARPHAGPTGPPSAAARRGRSRPARRRSPRSRDYYPGMAAFLANVGVNAAHRVRSPLHPDGSFELLPIPEKEPWAPPMLRLPGIWAGRAVHLDPDLAGRPPTYGDNCRTAGRAFSLRQALPGDAICFLARLQPESGPAGCP